jgi:hypothetical protein
VPYLVKKIGHSIAHGYVPQAPIIVDLGMHEGEFAAEIHEVWPDAKVYGCEPVPRWFEKLSAAGANRPVAGPGEAAVAPAGCSE